ncbi:MAG: glycosyltransferase [Deltaproteobacteria bacterium]|nr:glycosyltransferase [Deltaproteobacteria bacterium]
MMLYKLLSTVDHKRFEHVVVSLIDKGTVIGKRIEELGVPMHTLGMQHGRLPTLDSLWSLICLGRQLKPNIIQGWMYHGNMAALLVSALVPAQTKVIWNIRQTPYDLKQERRLTSLLIRAGGVLSSKPARIIYNSGGSLKLHKKLGYAFHNNLILANGFDCEQFKPDVAARYSFRRSLKLDSEAFLIGIVGRYHPRKDHANFLQASGILERTWQNVHFILAGRGMDHRNSELAALIRQISINGKIHLLGKRTDIPHITAALDIASSSSRSEGFPNVIGEAMACGVPCVVTDVGDSAKIVDVTGIVVPPRDPQALADGWRRMIEMGAEARRKLGIAARKRIQDNYSLSMIAGQYEDLYHKVVTEKLLILGK